MNWSYDNSMARLGKSSVSGGYSFNANSVGNSSSSSSAGAIIGSIFGSLATGLGAAMVSNKMAGAGKPTSKQISKEIANVVNNMPTQIATKVTTFNTKYGAAGIEISSDGTVSKSYDTRKKELTDSIAKQEKEVLDSNGNTKEDYQKYTEAKAHLSGLKSAKTAYNTIQNQIDNFKEPGIFVDRQTGKAKVMQNTPDPQEYKRYLSPEDQKKDNWVELAKNTNKYKEDYQALENKCKKFDNLINDQKNILNGLRDKDNKPIQNLTQLDTAINDLQSTISGKSMPEAGLENQKIKGTNITFAQHDKGIESLKKQLTALGSKEDFETAVKEIKQMNTKLADALKVQKEEQDVKEANNEVKYTKKNIWQKIFGGGNKDVKKGEHKAAKANRKIQVAERESARTAWGQTYM